MIKVGKHTRIDGKDFTVLRPNNRAKTRWVLVGRTADGKMMPDVKVVHWKNKILKGMREIEAQKPALPDKTSFHCGRKMVDRRLFQFRRIIRI